MIFSLFSTIRLKTTMQTSFYIRNGINATTACSSHPLGYLPIDISTFEVSSLSNILILTSSCSSSLLKADFLTGRHDGADRLQGGLTWYHAGRLLALREDAKLERHFLSNIPAWKVLFFRRTSGNTGFSASASPGPNWTHLLTFICQMCVN